MSNFRCPLRIQFVDTDASGRIHYTAILRHFEKAETEFFRHLGIPYNHITMKDISLPRVHVEADYLRALTYDDEIEIEVTVARVGEKSFTLGFDVLHDGHLAVRGKIVVASMDRATQRSCPLPALMREQLSKCVNSSQGT